MFTASAPSPPTISTSTPASTSPASPSLSHSRSGRLRGLSYLRSYTNSYLHSHNSSSPNSSSRPSLARATSHPATGPSPANPISVTTLTETPLLSSGQTDTLTQPGANPNSQSTTNGWLPAGGSRSQASRVPALADAAVEPATAGTVTTVPVDLPIAASMTRNPAATVVESPRGVLSPPPATVTAVRFPLSPPNGEMPRNRGESAPEIELSNPDQMPLIRFIPYQEPRSSSSRPSLHFTPISRTLPSSWSVIRVGRYSERDNTPEIPDNVPSAAPVGFKSKVVSRRHCEFWCQGGQWYIKDVKSSSGTFLNHIRLSQPGVESKPFRVRDGDIVQLGIDFRGGEEMIFRCVKIRIECNRGWQRGLNNFNKNTHKRIRNLAKSTTQTDGDSASTHSSECSICLMSVAPCQSLFVAPCSHVWHYKCIRPMLLARDYPSFQCPNCRAMADLEADVDDVLSGEEEWEQAPSDIQEHSDSSGPASPGAENPPVRTTENAVLHLPLNLGGDGVTELAGQIGEMNVQHQGSANARSEPDGNARITSQAPVANDSNLSAPRISQGQNISSSGRQIAVPALETAGADGPLTPRNDVGPFILDGSGSRGDRRNVSNLESVVNGD